MFPFSVDLRRSGFPRAFLVIARDQVSRNMGGKRVGCIYIYIYIYMEARRRNPNAGILEKESLRMNDGGII